MAKPRPTPPSDRARLLASDAAVRWEGGRFHLRGETAAGAERGVIHHDIHLVRAGGGHGIGPDWKDKSQDLIQAFLTEQQILPVVPDR